MTAHEETVAVVGTGDMGSAVGGALVRAGYRVVTAGEGRGDLSRRLAAEAGIEDVGSLEAAVGAARLVLSIVPPAAATTLAAEVVGAMHASGARPAFADCNAVSPETVLAIGRALEPTGAPFVDVGIVGRGPGVGRERTRFYVSGAERAAVLDLDVEEDGVLGAEQRHRRAARDGPARGRAARRARAADGGAQFQSDRSARAHGSARAVPRRHREAVRAGDGRDRAHLRKRRRHACVSSRRRVALRAVRDDGVRERVA